MLQPSNLENGRVAPEQPEIDARVAEVFQKMAAGGELTPDEEIIFALAGSDHAFGLWQQNQKLRKVAEMAGNSRRRDRLEISELTEKATFDGLTNLLTRKRGDEILSEEAERAMREKTIFSVVLVDLDHFKKVNDTFGHAAGDAVLRLASEKVRASVREYDRCIRYGGEELAVVLPNADEKAAAEVAERIRASFEAAAVEFGEQEINFTASLGVAELNPEVLEDLKQKNLPMEEFLGQIYDCADRALYSAKEGGRNQVVCCSEVLPENQRETANG